MSEQLASTDERARKVLDHALALYARHPDWVTFYRQVFARGGWVRRMFPTPESLAEFERTETYLQLQRMLAQLRADFRGPSQRGSDTSIITVRIPKAVYENIRKEAFELETTINQLCISKLLQVIAPELVLRTTPGRPASGSPRTSPSEPPDQQLATFTEVGPSDPG